MRYKAELGIFGNIKALFTEGNKTNNTVSRNKAETDYEILQTQADMVETVIDEYNAIVGEENENV